MGQGWGSQGGAAGPPALATLTIQGYRGFGPAQVLRPAQPTGAPGSGLTALVGANNAGKSTIIEVCGFLSRPGQHIAFAGGQRHLGVGGRVAIDATWSDGLRLALATIPAGGSETEWVWPGWGQPTPPIFVLPSRRAFPHTFGYAAPQAREGFGHSPPWASRGLGGTLAQFPGRLAAMQRRKPEIDALLARLIDPAPDWYVDREGGDSVLRLRFDTLAHTSEGAGEGLLSLLTIVDSLYDSTPGEVIVVDEPELSLHPALQKNLLLLFAEYARDRQIIYTTHSPYLVDWAHLFSGGTIVRALLVDTDIALSALQPDTVARVASAYNNRNNPHVFGLDAREVFFQVDPLILVEGQDDVVHYPQIAEQLGVTLPGSFYGWGVGGAGSMALIAQVVAELGFRRVAGLLDSDKVAEVARLTNAFLNYRFRAIPALDVRDKDARRAAPAVDGLVDRRGRLKEEHTSELLGLLGDVVSYLRPTGNSSVG